MLQDQEKPSGEKESVRDEEGEILTLKPPITCQKAHYFEMVRSGDQLAAECRNCHTGYPLSAGADVSNGHVYLYGELVI